MTNIVKLKVPKKMTRKPKRGEVLDNVVELPLQNSLISPQELLAKLSRNTTIKQVLVIFPIDSEDGETQYPYVLSSNMTNADVNFMADQAKLSALGIPTS